MKKNQASETAAYTAAMRAIANVAPQKKKILIDPYALEFMGFPWALTRIIFYLKFFNPLIYLVGTRVPDIMVGFPGMTALSTIRHRYIDEQIIAAYQQGIRQFIFLGAGYDSRPARLPLDDASFIEIDHPDTQSRKKYLLKKKDIPYPDNTRFIPLDFSEKWAEDLFNLENYKELIEPQASMIVWEGVSCYLKPEAVIYTFQTINKILEPGSRFVFDAFPKDIYNPETDNVLLRKMQNLVNRKGEPFYWGDSPESIKSILLSEGFSSINYKSVFEISERLATKAHLKLKPYEILHNLNMYVCHK